MVFLLRLILSIEIREANFVADILRKSRVAAAGWNNNFEKSGICRKMLLVLVN